DYGKGSRPRAPHRRGAGEVHAAQSRGGEEDRRAGLVRWCKNVLEISERMIAQAKAWAYVRKDQERVVRRRTTDASYVGPSFGRPVLYVGPSFRRPVLY